MIDISCDRCGKRYRIDDTRMKSATGEGQVQGLRSSDHRDKPQTTLTAESIFETGRRRPGTAAAPQPQDPPRRAPSDPAGPRAATDDGGGGQVSGGVRPEKPRFGLFGKTLILMLLISILPFAIFWFLTFRETSARIRSDSEALLAQTAKGLGDQMDGWVNANFAVLRTIRQAARHRLHEPRQQEPILKAISREYPWMYLVFTVGPNGMNTARNDGEPLVAYADRQYLKDVMAGKALSWQTVVGRTSNVPALVIAVPIKEDQPGRRRHGGRHDGGRHVQADRDLEKRPDRLGVPVGREGLCRIAPQPADGPETGEPERRTPSSQSSAGRAGPPSPALFTDESGQPALGHARSNTYGWVLALQQEEQEMFDSLTVLQNFALALLAVTALLAGVIAWFSARGLVNPDHEAHRRRRTHEHGGHERQDRRSLARRDRPAGPGHRPHADQPAHGDGTAEEEKMRENAYKL